MSITVLLSQVVDGSMYNRKDQLDADVIKNRTTYLAKHHVALNDTTRLHPNAYQRAEIDHETDWCRYVEVDTTFKNAGMKSASTFSADAIITKDFDHALLLPVADCVGATFYDPVHHVLGLAHLGRHSLEQQGAVAFVDYLTKHYDSDPKHIQVWLSPAPGKDVYPIWALDNKGMKEVTFEQLHSAGILDKNITDNSAETDKDKNYFSYSEFLKGHRDIDGDHAMVAVMTR